ncbi:MAG: hypothetical protein HY049_13700 [Acidobacteria bacterium]|nr:hypothetical protein [Acidobacteriota bacterium]
MSRPFAAVALALLVSGTAVDPGLFQDLHWRLVGPFRAGRTLAVSGVSGERDHFYFGAVNGGVWESVNAGRTWRPLFDDQPIGSIGALAVSRSNPKVIYAGTGEADMRSDISQGEGIFKSVDGGKTWAFAGLRDSQQIGRIIVHPRNPDVVIVAALGHPYGPNEERGLYRSRDGGGNWTKVLGGDENVGAIDAAFEPGDPNVVYAALWRTRRTPWNIYPPAGGSGSGLFKSTDGGDHFTRLTEGLPAEPGRIGIAVARSTPRRVYALVDAAEGGLYRSDDSGAHFRRVCADERIWERGWYFGDVAVDPKDADVVYVGDTSLYRSADGGATFQPVKGAPGGDDYHELWIDPDDPARRILGTDQGAVVSVDGGATWSSWYNQPTAQLYRVSTDDRFPYRVYGPQQDSGAVALPSRTTTQNGITMSEFREITAGGEAQNVVPDPLDPETIYGGTVEKLDLRTGQARDVDPTLAFPDIWRRTWTLPLAFSPLNPHALYFARQRVFRTEDGGAHWSLISPDLTRPDPGAPPNLDPVTAAHDQGTGPRRGVVYSLAPSKAADRDLWAGTDDGLIWRTRDDGAHWEDVTPQGLTPWSKVGVLESSRFDAETAYAAVDRHRLEDRKPYIYRTHDGGRSWQLVVSGILPDHFVNAVRADPVRRGLLYAATEKGVDVSFDDGDNWQPLQLGLPVTSVRDLVVHGDDLVIATHGRGIWILDDVSPLRQISADVAASSAWLFQPALAHRVRPDGFTGTPLPKDEPLAANPRLGAVLDYLLGKAPRDPVALEIRDSSGAVVARFSSADAGRPRDPSRVKVSAEWEGLPAGLSASPGMHRFVWSLRYAVPEALAAVDPSREGVWAPPGVYVASLIVDGSTVTRRFEVTADPRVTLSAAGYLSEFALAREVEGLATRVAVASDAAGKLQKEISRRRAAASGAVALAFDAFQRDLSAVTGGRVTPNRYDAQAFPPREIATLAWVAGALGSLMEAVDGADAAPTADARAGFEKLGPIAGEAIGRWEGMAARLKELNERLRGLGAEAVVVGE